jgi:UDP-glucose 4-epimerase
MGRDQPDAAVFNVCTGQSTSVLELAKTLGLVCGRKPDMRFEAARAGDIRASLGDPSLARAILGFRAATPLEEGLRRLRDGA